MKHTRKTINKKNFSPFLFTLCITGIFGLFMTTTYAHREEINQKNIVKSANDKRDYAYAELDNGLKLLVVSDKEAQRAAAAVDVNVGSSADFDEFPGLAHFLEHMLFLGTDKYPDPDDYINYISEHGGSHNAFTAFDHTNYFFDIDPKHLHDGLKRFSRFFVAPLMAENYVKRERKAVDSEFQSKLREDGWRGMDVIKQAVNRKHPYSKFNVGNRITLPAETVRPALLEFYEKHYSADRMTAVIIGKEDAETLLSWGKTLFSDVPKRENPADLTINEKLFAGKSLPMLIESQSIKNEKNLSLTFQFPYHRENDYSKLTAYISYILGYEGQGSLLETLKKMGYASELYTGAGHRVGNEISFEISIQFTDKGYENRDKVLAVIFAYIELLKQDKDGESRYKEIATVAETAFEYREKGSAMHEVSSLTTRLNRYPVEDVLALGAIYRGYDKAKVDEFLAMMTPDVAIVHVTAPEIKTTEKTHYFQVPYTINTMKVAPMTNVASEDKALVEKMYLPKTNPFVADNYKLQSDSIGEKHEVLANGIELYYKNDISFDVPRSSVQISLQPTAEMSVADKVAMSLLADLLDEQITTTLYDASLAGLHADIVAGERSIIISLEGYQQKMPELLAVILAQLKNLNVDTPTFTLVKDTYRQDLENFATKMPYQQTFAYLNKIIVKDATVPSERLEVLDAIDEASIKVIAEKITSSLAVRMLVYGNDTYAEATALADAIAMHLPEAKLDNVWQGNSAKSLTENLNQTIDVEHEDNAITYYIQADEGNQARAEIGLLGKMVEPQFFTQLRTEKQLGYVVFAYPRPTYNQAAIAFTIQSPAATADELEKHIVEFNTAFLLTLDKLTEAEFDEVKTILKSELLQKPENLMSAANIYWSDILTTDKTDSSRQAIADAVDNVELKSFVKKMQNVLKNGKHASVKALPTL